ncbi:MAG: hypothetical protein JWP66_1041 [Naasia sp.]|nr:hypothetical protein [Naasia sp.]
MACRQGRGYFGGGGRPAGTLLSLRDGPVSEEPVHSPLPPSTAATQPVAVRALVRRELRDGLVLGWRGDRVYLRWRTEAWNHLGWVPASDVERVWLFD